MSGTILLGAALVGLAFIFIPTIYGFITGAPLLFSPVAATEEALKKIDAREGERFCDLGMGNGRTLAVARKTFGLEVSGFELSPLIFWLARLNLFLYSVKKSKLYRKDFYKQDLSRFDILFCFLTPPAMERLAPKLKRELKPGARVISYAFRMPGWKEAFILENCPPGKVYIYVKE